jgi:hypothetical protein
MDTAIGFGRVIRQLREKVGLTLSNGNQALALSLLAFFATIYLPVISFLISGSSAYFKFFAADTFYYLTIAANTSWINTASFDGVNPTNGFHPFWQFLLKSIFSTFHESDKIRQLSITFWLSTFFVGLSTLLITWRLKKINVIKFNSLIFLALTPGLLYFLISLPNPNYGHLWSYVNGMESPLSLLLFASLFFIVLKHNDFYAEDSVVQLLGVGVITSLIILARLDDVFILVGIAAPILWSRKLPLQKLKQMAWLGLIPLLSICFYMWFNNRYAGSYLPISGHSKLGVSLKENLFFFFNGFVPLLPLHESGWKWWNETTWRALHMVVPLAIAGLFLFNFVRSVVAKTKESTINFFDSFLAGMSIYIILKAFYNIIFVGIFHQGHWYYPISILVSNIIIARFLALVGSKIVFEDLQIGLSSKAFKSWLIIFLSLSIATLLYIFFFVRLIKPQFFGSEYLSYRVFWILIFLSGVIFLVLALAFTIEKKFVLPIPIILICTVFIVFLSGNSILSNKERAGYNKPYENLFKHRLDVKSALLNIDQNLRLLSFDDGIEAYSLGLPTMSGLGFALDKQAFEAKKEGRLLQVAYDRGFKWLTTLIYMPEFIAQIGDDVTQDIASAFWLSPADATKYRFTLIYVDTATSLKIISFEPVK